jgi:hypothetical protein
MPGRKTMTVPPNLLPALLPGWVKALLLAVLTLAFGAGWAVNGWRLGAALAQQKTDHANALEKAARQAVDRINDAQRRNDALTAALTRAENQRIALAQEKDREIRRLTTGRRCLDAAAVRVLNYSASARTDALPEAVSEPVSADAAFATDTDVGLWARTCRDSYDTCRGRLDAIADFYREP